MANAITKHIPNTVTCFNLFSGCIASVMAFEAKYEWAMFFIVLGAIFDFFDGMLARLLKAPSPIGKELDSLADMITFGFAPAVMLFSFFKEPALAYPEIMPQFLPKFLPYVAFLLAIFSGLRLAKFNVDERQTSSFIGMPTPANALFWSSLIVGCQSFLFNYVSAVIIVPFILFFCWLLVAEIPMFSLKFKNLSWKDNKVTYIFLAGCLPLLIFLHIGGIAAVIVWYILLSLITRKN